MSLPFLILLIGFLYALLVGGLALLRREGISVRFILESVAVTLLASGLAAASGIPINPVVFLMVLYLVTMRVRLLIDLANLFAKQGRFNPAERLYGLASRLWPDITGNLVLKINQATLLLQENKLEESAALFTEALQQADQGRLGVKYEAAAHYNLGVAYLRSNMDARAAVEFNAAIDTWPMSLYARRAEEALEKRRRKNLSARPEERP
jgi:tetratricopeptide (TPR) repeat protein